MANLPKTPPVSLSSSNHHHRSSKSSSSVVVVLHQWWLINYHSKLALGGFLTKQSLESRMRVFGSASAASAKRRGNLENQTQQFQSAAILKRLDNNTLEAEDGTIITITGNINTSRTLSYGFSHQVCDRFLDGFPSTWEEEYAAAKLTHDKRNNTNENSSTVTLDDLPLIQVRDLIMSTTGESESCALSSIILRDIMKHCSEVSLNQDATSVDSDDNVSRNSTEPELDHKLDGVYLSNPTPMIIEEHKINSFPAELHEKDLETSKYAEDTLEGGGFMSSITPKISKTPMKRTGSQTRYSLRSTKKGKTHEVSDLDD